jgi:hypothetical protein
VKLTVTVVLLILAVGLLGWQEVRVRLAEQGAAAARRAAAGLETPLQVDDSTTVTRALEGMLLERDASIRRLTRQLQAATRAQMDLHLALERRDLPPATLHLDQATRTPADSGLIRYEVPFVLADGDSVDGLCVAGRVGLDQPGPDWLPSLAVTLDQVRLQAGVAIDLVEGKDGWRAITRSSSPALSAGISLAVQPKKTTWRDRFHPLAGLGVQDGHPRVMAGARLDPWGVAVSAGAGAVGVTVFKSF